VSDSGDRSSEYTMSIILENNSLYSHDGKFDFDRFAWVNKKGVPVPYIESISFSGRVVIKWNT